MNYIIQNKGEITHFSFYFFQANFPALRSSERKVIHVVELWKREISIRQENAAPGGAKDSHMKEL